MRCGKCSGLLIQDDESLRCLGCGSRSYQQWDEHVVAVRDVTQRVHIPIGQCRTVDCNNHVFSRNKTGFCRECQHALYNWQRSDPHLNVIQPIIQIESGHWFKNPASLTWKRKTAEYQPQRATGNRRSCTRCGDIRFIRRQGMCWKCLHAVRQQAPCTQCGCMEILSVHDLCIACAAENMVANWLAAGERNHHLKPVQHEPLLVRQERLRISALKRINRMSHT